jgi:hypothetical protein
LVAPDADTDSMSSRLLRPWAGCATLLTACLLPGAPALTRTGLSPAGLIQLSRRTTAKDHFVAAQRGHKSRSGAGLNTGFSSSAADRVAQWGEYRVLSYDDWLNDFHDDRYDLPGCSLAFIRRSFSVSQDCPTKEWSTAYDRSHYLDII